MTKEEIFKKIDELVNDDSISIQIFELLDDFFIDTANDEKDKIIEDLKKENEEILKKYKERFLSGEKEKEEIVEIIEDTDDIIDIKEI